MAQIPVGIISRNYTYEQNRHSPGNLDRARHCRSRSSVNRNCSNLIRIPRPKSVKTKQVLPNILSLNARSIVTETDELALVIHNQKIRHSNAIRNLAF